MKKTLALLVIFASTILGVHSAVKATATDYAPSVMQIVNISSNDSWGVGTGFFINWDGAILTNYHVVADAVTGEPSDLLFLCLVEDVTSEPVCSYTAEVFAYDENLDIAMLFPSYQLDDDGNIVSDVIDSFETDYYLNVSNYPPELSEEVYILGFPDADLSASITSTEGVVSSFLDGGTYFVTDATVNPGNSGGPVFSYYDDKVLGIASAVSYSGVGGNYGYAISNTAIYDWFVYLAEIGTLNTEFVDEMFSDETGYEIGDEIFSDVTFGDENSEAISYLKDVGILNGYPDGSFLPENTLNRAELLKILVEGAGYTPDSSDYKNCFPDVSSEWYAKYVCFAEEQGWVEGYPDNTFQPEKEVNKVEAIKMMLEVFDVELFSASSDPFEDVDSSAWFADYILTARDLGLLEEDGDYYYPADDMTRAGISENLYRLIY